MFFMYSTMDGSGNGVVYGGESIADLYLNSILLITNMLAVFDWKLFNNIRVYVLGMFVIPHCV